MFEAVVTFITYDEEEWNKDPTNIVPVTKVYRLEFDSEVDFRDWMHTARQYTVNTERLVADGEDSRYSSKHPQDDNLPS
jgi:hypothetical protein